MGIGLLGLGVVGTGILEITESDRETYRNVFIKKILIQDPSKTRDLVLDKGLLTTDYEDIIDDDGIDIIIEVTGDVEKGYDYVRRALESGRHVISANKALISKHFEEFSRLAEERNLAFLYEASVGGGIPIVKALRDQMRTNEIQTVKGILNGTSNYILTKMTKEELPYKKALGMAQDLGYAELDPSDDVEGLDSLRKLRILSSLSLRARIGEENILLEGMERITFGDISLIKKLDRVVKLVGHFELVDGGYQAMVMPCLLDKNSTYAKIDDAYNIIELKGDRVGTLRFYGQGAGKFPTANAVINDLLDIVEGSYGARKYNDFNKFTNHNKFLEGRFYLRISEYTTGLAQEIESIAELILFREGDLVILTRKMRLAEVYRLLDSHAVTKSSYFIGRLD